MNKPVKAAIAAAIVVGATSYASPYWTLYQMRSAIETRDADKFSRYVDYPALRESLKAQLTLSLQQKLGAPALQNTPFAGIGQAIGLAVINTMIDTMVSPAGVMALMAGEKPATAPQPKPATPPAPTPAENKGEPAGPAKEEAAKDALKYRLSYRALNTVEASATKDNGDRILIGLTREGLWSWKWSSVVLPELSKP
ncbi:hypothetical protein OR16_36242 [Cupriavidus basilensis OR16]|uniref:DUF2939 domain-containing protein n=1 Tax=Cupriavidus basilensis OR16 TaxID=1127483 RepID=H1SFW2_9BURK|nr:DUF2939 domain-containing protein [Cupriavidus basilensis]EHP38684.1 hypothetical protein OR16_36242 [Cupriavidus basilensis OR16]